MANQGSNLLLSIFLFMATFFYLHRATIATEDAAITPTHAPTGSNTNAIAFIHLSCRVTHYPDVCYSTLSRHADTINEDPIQLARIALSLSVNEGRGLVSYMANLTSNSVNSNAASAIHDCFSNLGDVVDEVHDSLKQIHQINSADKIAELFKLQISNVQTWMSAELNIVDSCSNGLEGIKDSTMKTNIEKQITVFKKLTSNALAIVNNYATSTS